MTPTVRNAPAGQEPDPRTEVRPEGRSELRPEVGPGHSALDDPERSSRLTELQRQLEYVCARNETQAREIEALRCELQALTFAIGHDVRAPLITIEGFAQLMRETGNGQLDESMLSYLEHIEAGVARMHGMIAQLLELSRIASAPLRPERIDVTAMAAEILQELRSREPARRVEQVIAPGLAADGDRELIQCALEELLQNAWKFTSTREPAHIELDAIRDAEDKRVFRLRDNGVGFDPKLAPRLFAPFQRCHSRATLGGEGIGLATVQRILRRHGGRAWIDARPDGGATVYFTLGG